MKSKKPINNAPDCREKNQINSKYNQDESKVLSLHYVLPLHYVTNALESIVPLLAKKI